MSRAPIAWSVTERRALVARVAQAARRTTRATDGRAVATAERLRAAFEHGPDAIVVHRDGRLELMNRVARRIFGYATMEELVGRPAIDHVHPDDRARLRALAPRIFDGAAVDPFEVRWLRLDGTSVWMEVHVTRLPGDGPPAVLVIGRQTSERIAVARAHEARLAELARERDALARAVDGERAGLRNREAWSSMIAHELRQPLSAILAYSTAIARRGLPDDVAAQFAHVTSSARRLERMIVDLSDVSAIEGSRFTLRREPVDLAELLRSAAARASTGAEAPAVDVRVRSDGLRANVDGARVEQVLSNLVGNARKYGDRSRPIVVELDDRGSEATIAVTNHGPTIPADDLPHLFERFYRTGSARRGRAAGLGLGLYIARCIVEAHGGRIRAESGAGTTRFEIALPLGAGARDA